MNSNINAELNITDITAALLKREIRNLENLKKDLQEQFSIGMIDAVDFSEKMEVMNKTEFISKRKLVETAHTTRQGTIRSIKEHEPTASYRNGYVYTKLKGGKTLKAKTRESLYEKLYAIYFNNGQTVREVFQRAFAEKEETENPSANTLRKTKNDFNRYISQELGDKNISEVTEYDLTHYSQDFVNPPFTRTRKQFLAYKGILNLIFDYAVVHHLIDSNPTIAIKNARYLKACVTKISRTDEEIFTSEDIAKLQHEVYRRMTFKKYGSYYINGYAMLLAIETGMRIAELCALKWEDIDFQQKTIHIHRQLLRTENKGMTVYEEVPFTKNERGISKGGRYFPITQNISALLSEIQKKQKQNNIVSAFVLGSADGQPLKTETYHAFLRRICRKFGLKATHNHAFRKSLNSYVLIPNGINVTNRAKLLGHSPETNLKNYSFESLDYVKNALEVIDKGQKELLTEDKRNCLTIPFPKEKPHNAMDARLSKN